MVLGSKMSEGIYFQLIHANTNSRYVKPVGGSQTTPYFSADLGWKRTSLIKQRKSGFSCAAVGKIAE